MAPAAVVLMLPAKPGMCWLCTHRYVPGPERYTDEFGYTYHLCRAHYMALVSGLVRIEARRLARSRVAFGTGTQAIHPDVQEAVVAVLADVLAERLLSSKEEPEPVEKGRA